MWRVCFDGEFLARVRREQKFWWKGERKSIIELEGILTLRNEDNAEGMNKKSLFWRKEEEKLENEHNAENVNVLTTGSWLACAMSLVFFFFFFLLLSFVYCVHSTSLSNFFPVYSLSLLNKANYKIEMCGIHNENRKDMLIVLPGINNAKYSEEEK